MYDGLRLLQLLSTRSLASILVLPNISFHFISRGLNFGANSRKILIANCKVGAGISDQEGISGHYTDGYLSRLCWSWYYRAAYLICKHHHLALLRQLVCLLLVAVIWLQQWKVASKHSKVSMCIHMESPYPRHTSAQSTIYYWTYVCVYPQTVQNSSQTCHRYSADLWSAVRQ